MFKFKRVVVGGDSAGACLSISMTLAIKDLGLPLPACLWCSSPVDDILYSTKELYKQDMLCNICPEIFKVYAPGGNPQDPYLSPIYGDFNGMPPMLIQTGGEESFSAGATRLAVKAAAADVEVVFHYAKDMGHCYSILGGTYDEAVNGFKEITEFINYNLDLDWA